MTRAYLARFNSPEYFLVYFTQFKTDYTVGPPGTDHITTHSLASWPELRVTEDAHENLD